MKFTIRQAAITALIAGGTATAALGTGLVTITHGATASQSNAGAPVAQPSGITTSGTSAANSGSPGGSGVHRPGARFGIGGPGRYLNVTSVSGDTITAKDRTGKTVTVVASAATTYSEAGASASLTDIKAGSTIAVRGTSTTTSGRISATAITIVLPQVTGVVKSVNGSTMTVTGLGGATHTVLVTGSTRYQRAGQGAAATATTASAVKVGVSIMAEGSLSSDGKTLTAQRVLILPAQGAPGMSGPGPGGPAGTNVPSI